MHSGEKRVSWRAEWERYSSFLPVFCWRGGLEKVSLRRIMEKSKRMELKKVRTSDKEYAFAEQLLQAAFPEDEYRDLAEQRRNTDCHPMFFNNVVLDDAALVGILAYWKLPGFYYIEHLAVAPEYRNGGYGRKVLDYVQAVWDAPVVLEVELPETDLSKRRIGFYERAGYRVFCKDYLQPAYRPGGNPLPLYLMVNDSNGLVPDVESVKKELYVNVYNQRME